MNKIAYQSGCSAAMAAFKLADWNWELTANPVKKDAISSDNGRRAYGTNFTEPGRQNREVGQAFDQLNSTRPSDFINAGNEAMIGTMV